MIWDKPKDKTPVETLLGAFTDQSVRMHALAGFPGILLLLTVVLGLAPHSLGNVEGNASSVEGNALYVLAGLALSGAILTYLVESLQAMRRSEAEAKIINDFTFAFVESYLKGRDKVDAESVFYAINHIIGPLFDKKLIEASNTTPGASQTSRPS